MKRLVLFLLLSAAALAQTTVTATVVDPNGNPYANGTGSAYTVVASGQQSVTIAPSALSGAGAYSAAMAAGTYVFTFCSAPVLLGVPTVNLTPRQICFSSAPIAVSGSSLNITSLLNPVVIGPSFSGGVGPIRGLSFTVYNSAGLAAGTTSASYDIITVPFSCSLQAYNLAIDQGTITVKFWKVATGTAIPTSGNSISTSGVSIASGTAIHSTTLIDFTTTTVSQNDIMAMDITAVGGGATFVNGVLACQ